MTDQPADFPTEIEMPVEQFDALVAAIDRPDPAPVLSLAVGRRLAAQMYAAGDNVDAAIIRDLVSEEIAQALEVNEGARCPVCLGLPAARKWKRTGFPVLEGRCGAGHTWTAATATGFWRDSATIAREYGRQAGWPPAMTSGGVLPTPELEAELAAEAEAGYDLGKFTTDRHHPTEETL